MDVLQHSVGGKRNNMDYVSSEILNTLKQLNVLQHMVSRDEIDEIIKKYLKLIVAGIIKEDEENKVVGQYKLIDGRKMKITIGVAEPNLPDELAEQISKLDERLSHLQEQISDVVDYLTFPRVRRFNEPESKLDINFIQQKVKEFIERLEQKKLNNNCTDGDMNQTENTNTKDEKVKLNPNVSIQVEMEFDGTQKNEIPMNNNTDLRHSSDCTSFLHKQSKNDSSEAPIRFPILSELQSNKPKLPKFIDEDEFE